MANILRYLVCIVFCLSVLNVLTRVASFPYDLELDDYNPQEMDEAMEIFDDVPVKRGMCHKGFTYQAILRKCLPSLGALRGRGRNGRRGRRGLSPWSWRV